jgi:hypothetical protein
MLTKVLIPKTQLLVSRLCLGTNVYGTAVDQARSEELLDRFVELGGNFIDTARMYGDWVPEAPVGASERISHDLPRCTFTAAGQTVFVEGYTRGATRTGAEWVGGSTPGGRFCSVFEFQGSKIARMYIYLDPDYAGADSARFLWNEPSRLSW